MATSEILSLSTKSDNQDQKEKNEYSPKEIFDLAKKVCK